MTSNKVCIFSVENLSEEALEEVNASMSLITKKYNCQFTMTSVDNVENQKIQVYSGNRLKSALEKYSSDQNGVFLSFGGELELE